MLNQLLDELKPFGCELIAVSKTKSVEMIRILYDQGQRHFGENRVQEIVEKHTQLPTDTKWHFIGHLQSKKVKQIAPFVHLIHAVDSKKLLQEINKRAKENNRTIDVLLQIKVAQEESKHGYELNEMIELLEQDDWKELNNVRICGLMGMATFTDDTIQVNKEFMQLKSYFNLLKSNVFKEEEWFSELSMGMSGDYKLALQQGSTMVRIGSLLFG